MIIQHNISALNANRQMGINSTNTSKSMEKLSSGYAINRAGDDAAGLFISEKMRSQVRGLNQASKNAQDGISLIQTAEGALGETHEILQRMRELADKGATGTLTTTDRGAVQDEITQLIEEVDRIGNTTEFNTMKLLNGNLGGAGTAGEGVNVSGANIGVGTKGKMVGTALSASFSAVDYTKVDVIKIDGKDIALNWNALLTTDQQDTLKGMSPTTTSGAATTTYSVGKTLTTAITGTIGGATYSVGTTLTTTVTVPGTPVTYSAGTQLTAAVTVTGITVTYSAGTQLTANVTVGGTTYSAGTQLTATETVGGTTVTYSAGSPALTADVTIGGTLYTAGTTFTAGGDFTAGLTGNVGGTRYTAGTSLSAAMTFGGTTYTVGTTLTAAVSVTVPPTGTAATVGFTSEQILKINSILTDALNKAIDESGTGVGHVKFSMATSASATITNEAKGSTSKVEMVRGTAGQTLLANGTAAAGSNSVLDSVLNLSGGGATSTNGIWKMSQSVAATETFTMKYAGQEMQVTMGSAISANDTVDSAATKLKAAMNKAISAQNTASGKTYGMDGYLEAVDVKVTDDGRFQILAATGDVTLEEYGEGETLDKLGLSQSAVEAAGQGGMTLQIGANKGQTLSFSISDMRASALGIKGVNCGAQSSAAAALDAIDSAIEKVSKQRSKMGAVQNRLEHTIANLGTSSENLTAAESRIRDTDMATEMMAYTKNNILSQAAQSMLAQANQRPQSVLQLLG